MFEIRLLGVSCPLKWSHVSSEALDLHVCKVFDAPRSTLYSALRISAVRHTSELVVIFFENRVHVDILVSRHRFYRFSQILAMRNLKNFFCCWCWDKIRNNVWGTHRGNSFPQRNFSELISGRSLFDWKSSIFSRFEHKFAYILCLGCAFFFKTNHEDCRCGKPIVTLGAPPEGITQLKGFLQIRHLEDRYCSQTLRL